MTPFLSIAISSFNKGARVESLVKEILKFRSSEIAVTVVDDNSTDGTMERLSRIDDDRLVVVRNSSNKGACSNWFETINQGCGEYILHLLDRDWIQIEYFYNVLNILKSEAVDFGYIGNMHSHAVGKSGLIERYAAGNEALEKFAFSLIHPSGFLIRKDIWEGIENKEEIFLNDNYGIYPHSYIFALLAEKFDGVIIHYPLVKVVTSWVIYKSNFYRNNSRPYWWTPQAHKMELEALTRYSCRNINLPKNVLRTILQCRFCENIFDATVKYQRISRDPRNASHYGVKIQYVDERELIKINTRFTCEYILFIMRKYRELFNLKFIWILLNIGVKNMQDIKQYMQKIKWIDRSQSYKDLFLAWLTLRDEKKSFDIYFKWRRVSNIAVYGNGPIGQRFVKEMEGMETKVNYIIDKKGDSMVANVPIITLDDSLPEVDAIVVTVIDEFNSIADKLGEKCEYPVIPLEDVIIGSNEIE